MCVFVLGDGTLHTNFPCVFYLWASEEALVVRKLPASAGDERDVGSIPGWGRSPGGGHGNPLQNSCLENPMDRGAWQYTVHGVTKSGPQLKQLSPRRCAFCLWGLHYSLRSSWRPFIYLSQLPHRVRAIIING